MCQTNAPRSDRLSSEQRNLDVTWLLEKNWTAQLTMTMTKSSQHQALVKYLTKPRASHLTVISMAKMTVKILSM